MSLLEEKKIITPKVEVKQDTACASNMEDADVKPKIEIHTPDKKDVSAVPLVELKKEKSLSPAARKIAMQNNDWETPSFIQKTTSCITTSSAGVGDIFPSMTPRELFESSATAAMQPNVATSTAAMQHHLASSTAAMHHNVATSLAAMHHNVATSKAAMQHHLATKTKNEQIFDIASSMASMIQNVVPLSNNGFQSSVDASNFKTPVTSSVELKKDKVVPTFVIGKAKSSIADPANLENEVLNCSLPVTEIVLSDDPDTIPVFSTIPAIDSNTCLPSTNYMASLPSTIGSQQTVRVVSSNKDSSQLISSDVRSSTTAFQPAAASRGNNSSGQLSADSSGHVMVTKSDLDLAFEHTMGLKPPTQEDADNLSASLLVLYKRYVINCLFLDIYCPSVMQQSLDKRS